MQRRTWTAALVAAVVIGGVPLYWRYSPEATFERVISSELPLGCSRRQVEDWLDRHKVPHSHSDLTPGHGVPVQGAGGQGVMLGGVVEAAEIPTRDYCRWWCEADIFFFFDEQDRLAGHCVEVWYDLL